MQYKISYEGKNYQKKPNEGFYLVFSRGEERTLHRAIGMMRSVSRQTVPISAKYQKTTG